MNLIQKAKLAEQAVNNISRHDDEDMAVRSVILDKIEAHIEKERQAMAQRVTDRLQELSK